MITIIHPISHARFDQLLVTANRRTTFIMAFDSVSERLASLRKCELFMDDAARADRELFNLPTLMLANDRGPNTVLIRHPDLHWIDVTEATLEDLTRLQGGMLQTSMFSNPELLTQQSAPVTAAPAEPVAPTIGRVVDAVFNAIFNPRP